jgi:antitoxin ParD1/3/4
VWDGDQKARILKVTATPHSRSSPALPWRPSSVAARHPVVVERGQAVQRGHCIQPDEADIGVSACTKIDKHWSERYAQDVTLHVNLTPKLERFVHDRVRRGLYNNASEVVRDALRLLVERETDREARLQGPRRRPRHDVEGVRRDAQPDVPADEGARLTELGRKIALRVGTARGGRSADGEPPLRLREGLELLRLACDIMERNLRREHPAASDAEILGLLEIWMTGDAWAEETPGYLVRSPRRLERLLRDPD